MKEVKNPRLIETGYQSPPLKLWTLGPGCLAALPEIAGLRSAEKATEEVRCDPTSSA